MPKLNCWPEATPTWAREMQVDKSEYTGMKSERGITSRIGRICRGARFLCVCVFCVFLVSQKETFKDMSVSPNRPRICTTWSAMEALTLHIKKKNTGHPWRLDHFSATYVSRVCFRSIWKGALSAKRGLESQPKET